MDEASISALADSIKRNGLTDLPLVRRLSDGGFQMISGHRRKVAYALLAEGDGAFASIPCRIVDGIDDAQAEVLLHTANYFTRESTVMERARATRALGLQVKQMRAENPELKGERTSEIEAAIIRAQTGKVIASRTIEHNEQTARLIETKLIDSWKNLALKGRVSGRNVRRLAKMNPEEQLQAFERAQKSANQTHAIKVIAGESTAQQVRSESDELLQRSLALLERAVDEDDGKGAFNKKTIAGMEHLLDRAKDSARRNSQMVQITAQLLRSNTPLKQD